MRNSIGITLALATLVAPLTSMAQERGPAKPPPPLLSGKGCQRARSSRYEFS